MLICIGFSGEDEVLVTRTKIAYQRSLSLAIEVIIFAAGLLVG